MSRVVSGLANVPRSFLADFGLAKSVATGPKLTRTGAALGTPAYMSPEQARGEVSSLTPATDVWGLGCVLHEMLAGQPPWRGETTAAVVAAILTGDPAPIRRERPDAPPGLEWVLARALAKRAADRYPDAGALREDLDRVLRGDRPRARSPRAWRATAAALAAVAAALVWGLRALRPPADEVPAAPASVAPAAGSPLARARALRDSDPAAATALYAEALAEEPARHDWRVEHGLTLWSVGRASEARRAWEEVPPESAERGAARLYLGLETAFEGVGGGSRGDLEEAVSAGGRAAPLARAALDLLDGRWKEAREALRGLAGWEASLLRAYCEEWEPGGDPASQAREYEQALAAGPPLAWAHNNLGAARARLGDLEGALRSFETAFRIQPEFRRLLYNRANCLKEMGRHEEAREALTSLIERHPEMAEAWLNRGHVLSSLGDQAGAIRDYTRALEISPGLATALIWRGTLRLEAGDRAGAERDCEAALRLTPDGAPAWYARGNLRHDLGDPAGARDDYSEAIRLRPDYPEALTNRGAVRYVLGDFAGAIEDLRGALRYEGEYGEAAPTYLSLAKVLGESGDPAAAAETLRTFLRRHAGDPMAPKAREELDQWEKAAGPERR